MATYISSTLVSIFQAVAKKKNMTHPTIHQMVLEHKTKSEMWATNQRSGTTLLLHHPTFFALLVIEFLKIAKLSIFQHPVILICVVMWSLYLCGASCVVIGFFFFFALSSLWACRSTIRPSHRKCRKWVFLSQRDSLQYDAKCLLPRM